MTTGNKGEYQRSLIDAGSGREADGKRDGQIDGVIVDRGSARGNIDVR